jgi:hypothetical protein
MTDTDSEKSKRKNEKLRHGLTERQARIIWLILAIFMTIFVAFLAYRYVGY